MLEKVNVRAQLNPFSSDGKVFVDIDHGLTLDEITKTITGGVSVPGQLVVHIDDAVVADPIASGSMIPSPGSWVVMKVRPSGGGGGDVDKAQTWLGIGMVLTFALGVTMLGIPGLQPFGIQLLFSSAGMGATVVGLGMIPEQSTDPLKSTENALSIRGGRNPTPKSTDKIPILYGKHLLTPFNGARPYTAIGGTLGVDQYVTQMFCLGIGPMKISQIKIGEKILATNTADVRNGDITVDGSFSDVVFLQIRQDGTVPAGYGKTIVEDSPGVEITRANSFDGSTPIAALWRTTQKDTKYISVDILFPSGLYYYRADGKRWQYVVQAEVRCRPAGSGTAWSSCTLLHYFSITAEINTSIRFTTGDIALPSVGEWEIGIHRITSDITEDSEDRRYTSAFVWSAFRSIRDDEPVDSSILSDCVFIALKMRASKQLNGVIDQFNCIAESVYPVYSGSGSGASAWSNSTTGTANPAAAFLYTLRSQRVNARPWADARIDWPRIEAWYTTCATNGWTVNAVSASHTSAREILARIAACGRASPVLRDGKASVVVDEPKTVIAQHFTPRNVKSFSWSKGFEDLPYGYRVSWVNAADGYAENERTVPYDGYTEAEAEAKLEAHPLWGVDNADLAYKQTRYALAVRKLRRLAYVIETDPEGFVCEEGDLVLLSHDAILVGQKSGRVKTVSLDGSGDVVGITSDEKVVMEVGKTYGIQFFLPTGVSIHRYVTNVPGETNSVTLTAALPHGTDASKAIFSFGEAGAETIRCLVSAHEGTSDKGLRIYLVPEAPEVHTADSGTIPEFVSFITRPPVDERVETRPEELIAGLQDKIYAVETAVPCKLVFQATTIHKSTAGVYSPSALIISATNQAGTDVYAGRFVIAETTNGTDWTDVYTSSDDESSKSHTPSAGIKAVRVRLYLAGGIVDLRDEETIPVVVDGSSAVKPVFSNDLATVPASSQGVVTSHVGTGGSLQVFEGGTALTFHTVLAAGRFIVGTPVVSPSGKITVGARSGSGTTTCAVADHSAMAADTDRVTITYPITARRANGTDETTFVIQKVEKIKAPFGALIFKFINVTELISGEFKKTGGVDLSWDAQAYSVDSFTECFCSAQSRISSIFNAMFGLASSPSGSAGFSAINYAWYFSQSGECRIYESGVNIGAFGSYTTDTLLLIRLKAGQVEYLRDGVVVRTVPHSGALFFDSSFYSTAELNGIKNVAFGPLWMIGGKGESGANGTRTATLEMFQWASSPPTLFPSGTSVLTWATGLFTAPATPNGWSVTPGSSSPGQKLYGTRVVYVDTDTSATDNVTWPSSGQVAYEKGGAGSNGNTGPQGESSLGIGIKKGFSAFSTANDGEMYVHGFDTAGVAQDVDGYIYLDSAKIPVTKAQINPDRGMDGLLVVPVAGGTPLAAYFKISNQTWYTVAANVETARTEADYVAIGEFVNTGAEVTESCSLYSRARRLIEMRPRVGACVGIVASVSSGSGAVSVHQVTSGPYAFTASGVSRRARPGDCAFVRGGTATTGVGDTVKALKVFDGYNWDSPRAEDYEKYRGLATQSICNSQQVYQANGVLASSDFDAVFGSIFSAQILAARVDALEGFITSIFATDITASGSITGATLKSTNNKLMIKESVIDSNPCVAASSGDLESPSNGDRGVTLISGDTPELAFFKRESGAWVKDFVLKYYNSGSWTSLSVGTPAGNSMHLKDTGGVQFPFGVQPNYIGFSNTEDGIFNYLESYDIAEGTFSHDRLIGIWELSATDILMCLIHKRSTTVYRLLYQGGYRDITDGSSTAFSGVLYVL